MPEMNILVVDSSNAVQTFVRDLFESFSFAPDRIQCASDPQSALALARRLKPDFLLTDAFVDSPLSGMGLYREVLAFAPVCQFALFSSGLNAELQDEAKQAGALFLLPKPSSEAALRTALGGALKVIAKRNPAIDKNVRGNAMAAARHLNTLKAVAQQPQFKAGDAVVYRGNRDAVRDVILRRGELILQLERAKGVVHVSEVLKL